MIYNQTFTSRYSNIKECMHSYVQLVVQNQQTVSRRKYLYFDSISSCSILTTLVLVLNQFPKLFTDRYFYIWHNFSWWPWCDLQCRPARFWWQTAVQWTDAARGHLKLGQQRRAALTWRPGSSGEVRKPYSRYRILLTQRSSTYGIHHF